MVNVAINGFGRIGRNFLRAVLKDESVAQKFRVAAINVGPANVDAVAHMFKYDTIMGIYPDDVSMKNGELKIGNYRINVINQLDPAKIDWYKFGIDWVVESSGKFTDRKGAALHLSAGAKKVLITAPAKDEDVTIIPGVNDTDYDKINHKIVSLGSCTTNAIVPTLKVLHDAFAIQQGFMTTIHAYTNSQVLLDVEKKDLRRARAAALNIIPTSTGATKVIGKVIPDLQGLIGGVAVRVPVAKVSLIDVTFVAKEKLSAKKINNSFEKASKSDPLSGIVSISSDPLVSSDYSSNNYSVVIDGLLTDAKDNAGKLFGWYDNEWGYSVRLKDFLMTVS